MRLQNLPRSYTCPDLWYKFRDVLLAIGAWRYMLIEPYACEVKGGPPVRSPSVHLKFQLPHPLKAADARYADATSEERSVKLAAGEPGSLQAADCALAQQMHDVLLTSLPLRITAADFRCSAVPPTYRMTLTAMFAAPEDTPAGAPSGPAAGG